MNFSGTVVDEADETEWQIIDDWLSDRPSDRDDLAFSGFTDGAGRDRKRLHFWTTPMNLHFGYINENKQPR